MRKYDHKKIEGKWQKYWKDKKIYKTKEDGKKPKCYVLDMFPYLSGEGLHVGHPRGYIATDVYSRFKRMNGLNVLHPMGFDSFGLPAENYAIKNKIHPEVAVKNNVKKFKGQLGLIGFDYDWDREIITSDPNFYKWTQWIFLKMFENGLAYESYEPINFCPSCLTGLANEDVEDGKCERCATAVVKKPMRQWVLKITDYAERMLEDLNELKDWPEHIKEAQKNWIGKSEGTVVKFPISNFQFPINSQFSNDKKQNNFIEVFTTRVDTIFGCTYVVIAPESKIIEKLRGQIRNFDEVSKYIEEAKNKSDLQRTDLAKEKTGVELKGVKAINPFNNEELPIWVADYVLGGYGTGVVMAVPAHDERDFKLAKKYDLPIKMVICPNYPKPICPVLENAYTGEGHLVGSGEFDGLDSKTAREKMTKWLEERKLGSRKINYKLKDWVFSRQRYWGEPIPLIHCKNCGVVAVPEKDLPVKLPKVKFYEPTDTGESPLAKMEKWVNVKCPKCDGKGKRETNTMPQWAGSSWYYLRYIDPKNKKALVDKKKEKYWSPIDMYVGGTEHATRHLIYVRFWHKFLYDIGIVGNKEPFASLKNQGLIMGGDGRKMSKRWGNVINPNDVVAQFGADTLRVYEMFMGPFDQPIPWSTKNIIGVKRFLDNIWDYVVRWKENYDKDVKDNPENIEAYKKESWNDKIVSELNKTIKKVSGDIENFKFNTAISSLMIFVNLIRKEITPGGFIKSIPLPIPEFKKFLKLISPLAPHIAEEIWQGVLGEKNSIHLEKWPVFDISKATENSFKLVVQIDGKTRDFFEVPTEISEDEAKDLTLKRANVKKWVGDKRVEKVIYVPNRIINIVLKKMPILTFKPKIITKQLISSLKDRTKDIIVQRYGLAEDADKKTLEAIGDKYGITRERIRQITNFAFNLMKESPAFESAQDAFSEMRDHIEKKGKILSEADALLHLAGNDPLAQNHIYFLLVLGDDFTKIKEDEEFHHRWTTHLDHADKVHQALRALHNEINENDLISEKDIISSLKKHIEKIVEEKIDEEMAKVWLNLSKVVGQNAMGEWGRASSPSISPRGVRDLAYLVLRKEGSPMHFAEVAKKISSYFNRPANSATVHNELIKDGRFVLVGRGLYALAEWGYKYGTVRDIIKYIIKSEGPSSKDDIVKKVLKERYVKENTILVNLQNRDYFKRSKEGKYLIG